MDQAANLREEVREGTEVDSVMQQKIAKVCNALRIMLVTKNLKYGNSALEPLKVFSKGNAKNSILVRLDDKLSRIQNCRGDLRKNDIADLIGYLVLFCVDQGWSNFEDLID